MLVVHYTMIVIFFFNDTATTDIYTYRHTLSLHDALPILLLLKLQRPAAQAQMLPPDGDGAGRDDDDLPPLGPAAGQIVGERSEEHTSELQSLMRISYAVFCLKIQINTLHPIHQHTKLCLSINTTSAES